MNETGYVSTAQVAQALGVGVTTVKRWVDDGILPAHRTPGGHRKLLLADVLRLARQGNFPNQDLAPLLAASKYRDGDSVRALADQFFAAVKGHDAAAVQALLLGAYQQGFPLESLADDVIAPAMHQVGHDWEKGKIDVYQEHQGSLLCIGAVHALLTRVSLTAAPDRPLALGGAPEKDPYILALLLAELVLRGCGWEVTNLGPNTPLASFRKALAEVRPQLFFMSVSHLENTEAFLADYRGLYDEAQRLGIPVAIGGRALTEPIRAAMPYTTFGDGFAQLAAFARTLHPTAKPRPRGRPPRNGTAG